MKENDLKEIPPLLLSCVTAVALVITGCGGDTRDEEPSPSQETVLRAVDSVGIELGDPRLMFGNPVPCMDATGNLLVLDTVKRTVGKVSGGEDPLETVSVEGTGPGEFMHPQGIAPLPGGGFMLWSQADRKLALYTDEMELSREMLNTDGALLGPISAAAVSDTSVVCSFQRFQEDSVTGMISLHTSSLDEPDLILLSRTALFQNSLRWPEETRFMFTAVPGSGVYAATPDSLRWMLQSVPPGGGAPSEVEMEYRPVPLTLAERLHEQDMFIRRHRHALGTAAGVEFRPRMYRDAIRGVYADGEERLWILSGSGLSPEFLVISPQGESLFTCLVELPGWQDCDEWRFSIGSGGITAAPSNPELFPLVYIMEPVPSR